VPDPYNGTAADFGLVFDLVQRAAAGPGGRPAGGPTAGPHRVPGDPRDAARLAALTGGPLRDCRPAGGQHGVRHYRCVLADGRPAFAKVAAPAAAQAGLAPEAHGLRWLAEAGARD